MSDVARQELDRRLVGFFDSAAAGALPDGLLDDVYRVTRRIPQERGPLARRLGAIRSWWSAPFGTAPRIRLITVAAILLLALTVGLALVAGSQRRLPPPFGPARNGVLVYDIGGKLWAVEPDRSSRMLDIGLGVNSNPTFSPDGTRIAFWSRTDENRPLHLFVANADGSSARRVSRPEGVVGSLFGVIAWSPDGSRIAYASDIGGRNAIFVAAPDGSGVHQVSPLDRDDRSSPAWSPDGDLIAWRRVPDGAQTAELDVAAVDGSGERRLVTSATSPAVFAALQWSPDGSRLAYVRLRDGVQYAAIVDRDGANEQLVSEPWEAPNPPVWSNDGTRLAYSRPSGAVILDVATGAKQEIADGLAECAISWSPDDTTVLGFGSDCRHGLFRISAEDTSLVSPVTSAPGLLNGAGWQRVAP